MGNSHFDRSSIINLIRSVSNYDNLGLSMVTKRAIKCKLDESKESAQFKVIQDKWEKEKLESDAEHMEYE